MSIKTKKISELGLKMIDSAAAMEGVYLVGSESTGLACKIALSDFGKIMQSVAEGISAAAVASIDTSAGVSEISGEIAKLQAEDKTISAKIIDLEYRVGELENKVKSVSKSVSDIAADVIANISKIDDAMKKYDVFFKVVAEEDKLTLAKIQEASREVYPVA